MRSIETRQGGAGWQVSGSVASTARSRVATNPDLADGTAGHPWRPRHFALLALLGMLLGIMRAEAPIDTDALWSARFGVDFLASGHIPRTDTYSWTASGHPWIASSWAWNVVLGLGYDAGGVRGIWLVGVLLAGVIGLVVAAAAAHRRAAPVPTAMVFAVLGMLALVVSPRAQTVSNGIAVLLVMLLRPVLAERPARALLAAVSLVGVQVAWINLHSIALLGPVLLTAAGAAQLIAHRDVRPMRWGSFRLATVVTASMAACLCTPYGTHLITHAPEVRSASVGLINEWDHVGWGSGAQVIGLALVLAGAATLVMARRARRYDVSAVLAVLVAATVSAVRFAPMLAIFLVPEFAVALGHLHVRPIMRHRILAAEFAAIVALASMHLGSFGQLDARSASPSLIKRLPVNCTLINDYELGGAVILLRPDVRVSVDGRNDMYGRAGVHAAIGMLQDVPGTDSRIRSAGAGCVLAPDDAPLVKRLSSDPGWRIYGRDGVRTLLVRVGTR